MIGCALGVVTTIQPFFPVADLQVLSSSGHGIPIAHVFGYESPFTIGVAGVFLAIFLTLVATSVIEPIALWRSIIVILAGIGVIILMGIAILSSGKMAFDVSDSMGNVSGSYTFDALGRRVKVIYTRTRTFEASGKTTYVDMPRGKGLPDELTRVTIEFAGYAIIVLGFGLLLVGTIQLRRVLSQAASSRLAERPEG